jgi:hypothetical protein
MAGELGFDVSARWEKRREASLQELDELFSVATRRDFTSPKADRQTVCGGYE